MFSFSFLSIFLLVNNNIRLLSISFQTQNCPTMYKDMFYKANKWTVDSPMTMRTGRDRNMADIDAVFSSVYKT